MKLLKGSFLIILTLLLSVTLSYCTFYRIFQSVVPLCREIFESPDQEAIADTVRDNFDTLISDIESGDFTNTRRIKAIRKVVPGNDGFIEYSRGGAGFGPATSYWGFYYSPDDDLTEIWCAGEPLVQYNSGYMYMEIDSDNRYYTELICDHFYFYIAAF